ncbi:AfsR/SARP family transcriptional regulator [Amycolatopsis sp. CA-230715]|uniref:AfsR/SARP family transcriptional regulator n=1 Tax=Amycolatopsis sp. CA-230715 TaxID=2745196 RepID=UPI001C0149D5|nr:AfsR/SARP family transcriptional regulator [Amycolatopsis sp. CA-230715]QWF77843.1 Regulatory protein AfsR [Amycolatopsis sp. CA-230715]
MGASGLRFAVLGTMRGWNHHRSLDIGPPKRQAVLAALLLRGGRVATASELVDAVWGERPPARALTSLRTYVGGLRATLEPNRPSRAPSKVLLSVGDGYSLPLSGNVLDADLAEAKFASAERARRSGDLATARDLLGSGLALWSGDPLAGVPGPYAARQRARLAERRIALLETRFQLDLDLGRHAKVLPELRAISLEQPLREGLRGQLMTALYRCGRLAEALAVYGDTRGTLLRELGVEPGPELVALHRRFLAGQFPARAAAREVVVRRPRPAQLPAPLPDFTGRAGIAAQLAERLSPSGGTAMPITAISGMAGVGKTALAVHVAHRVRDEFPDGQLHADLRETAPSEAVRRFLLALGRSAAEIPATVEQRSALLRTTLAARRVLVVLDNVSDAEQVRPLLPGTAGCAVLIAGRVPLSTLPGATTCRLEVPGPAESLALFSRIVGRERVAAEPEAAVAVVAACGHLPLTVREVAERVAGRPSRPLASAAACLDKDPGLAASFAGFRLGFEQLSAEQARALRLLASATAADLPLSAVARILLRPEEIAEELAESLVDLQLLTSPAPGRYGCQDVVRRFAAELP